MELADNAHRALIPTLPDDVALDCLLRLPFTSFPSATSVSKLWRRHLRSPYFHRLRHSSSLSATTVVLSQAIASSSSSSSKPAGAAYRLVLLDPISNTWSSLPPLPDSRPVPLFCHLAAGGRTLAVAGGWDPATWTASGDVFLYDFLSGTWRRSAPMPGPRRSFFACAADDTGDALYVAGGHDEDKNALRSALRYDVSDDRWVRLPDMSSERDECKGVFRGGRFEVLGGYATEEQGRFGGSVEGFDPIKGEWDPIEEERLKGDMCPRTCGVGFGGKVYRCVLGKVELEEEDGRWRTIAEVPAGARSGTWVAAVGDDTVAVGGGTSHGGEHGMWLWEGERWRELAVPKEYSGHVQAGCCFRI